jgi:Ca2+-binding RTX toxin-like protein
VVSASRAGSSNSAVTVMSLAPPECAALPLDRVRIAANGGNVGGNQLLIGGPGNDNLIGGGGWDCIVGGAGNDSINAGGGNDVCIGGAGTDTFQNCETSYP